MYNFILNTIQTTKKDEWAHSKWKIRKKTWELATEYTVYTLYANTNNSFLILYFYLEMMLILFNKILTTYVF
jgi:hypothetical protein